jgi:hypothetical protein
MSTYTGHILNARTVGAAIMWSAFLFFGSSLLFDQSARVNAAPAAATAGPNFAGTGTAVSAFWTSPSSATGTNDNNCASDNNDLSNESIDLTNFSFGIPAGSTITGIRVEPKASYDGASSLSVTILKGGSPAGTAKTYVPVQSQNCAGTAFASLGGAGDLWGTTFTSTQVDAANFGVRITTGAADTLILLDAVRITVIYDPPVLTPTAARPAEVPEATTLLLFGGGLGGMATWLGWQRRRLARRKQTYAPVSPDR